MDAKATSLPCAQDLRFQLKAYTDIWTGDAYGGGDRLIPTGIMGSLRWWFEVLVRGLGGKACDPTVDGVRCPSRNVNDPHAPGHHCVVCELFGCAGWARKFRLMVVDKDDRVIQGQIRAGQKFILRFIPLRPIAPEEWCLLDATLRLIDDYGAMGGKTVFKPSDEWGIADLGADNLDDSDNQVKVQRSRSGLPLQQGDIILKVEGTSVASKSELEQLLIGKRHGERLKITVRRNGNEKEIETWAGKRHHQDFGLVKYLPGPDGWQCGKTLEDIRAYVTSSHWREAPHSYRDNKGMHDFSWASLENFWCVKGRYLARVSTTKSTFNQVVGRKSDKSVKERRGRRVIRWSDLLEDPRDEVSRWLAGSQRQQESKKVFSFKHPEERDRTFGFVKPGLVDFEEMKRRLGQVWSDFQPDDEFQTGQQILEQLFSQGASQ